MFKHIIVLFLLVTFAYCSLTADQEEILTEFLADEIADAILSEFRGGVSFMRSPSPSFRAPMPSFRAPTPTFRAPTPTFRAPMPTPTFRAPTPVNTFSRNFATLPTRTFTPPKVTVPKLPSTPSLLGKNPISPTPNNFMRNYKPTLPTNTFKTPKITTPKLPTPRTPTVPKVPTTRITTPRTPTVPSTPRTPTVPTTPRTPITTPTTPRTPVTPVTPKVTVPKTPQVPTTKVQMPPVEGYPGLKIDHKFIGQKEGYKLNMYVPTRKGVVIGKSGATIVNGLDLGQRTHLNDLKAQGLSNELAAKLTPYLGLKKQDALNFVKQNPLTLTPSEGQQLTQAVTKAYDKLAMDNFNRGNPRVQFNQLPQQAQTVIASVNHQYGSLTGPATRQFYNAALQQDWKGAANALRQMGKAGGFADRRNSEAALLSNL